MPEIRRTGFCVAHDRQELDGGSCANVLSQLSKLGVSTTMIAKIGDDHTGLRILQGLDLFDIGKDMMVTHKGGTSLYTVIYVDPQGAKAIVLQLGDCLMGLASEDLEIQWFAGNHILYTDMLPPKPALTAMSWAKQAGHPVVFNMQTAFSLLQNFGLDEKSLEKALSMTDVFAPCQEAVGEITDGLLPEDAVAFFRSKFGFRGTVVLTLGSQGSLIAHDDKLFHIKPFPVPVVDTTGAGDAYIGAFIYATFFAEMEASKAGEFASAAAALACQEVGARRGPMLANVQSLLGS